MHPRPGTTHDSDQQRQRFPSAHRLKKRRHFRHVQLKGRRIHTPHFLIVTLPNELTDTRLGITVTKKVGTAARRNRIKRVVREVFRRNRHLFPLSHDLVFIAKRGAVAIDYSSLLDEIRHAVAELQPQEKR